MIIHLQTLRTDLVRDGGLPVVVAVAKAPPRRETSAGENGAAASDEPAIALRTAATDALLSGTLQKATSWIQPSKPILQDRPFIAW